MNSRSLARAGVSGAAARRATGVAALALLAVLAHAPPASAQGAAPGGDSVTVIARQRYNEGVAAYDAGRFEDARAAFLQAYALKHHPAVLLNLGQSELRSGHQDDAGNHLQQFLREHATATPDQRTAAEKGIAEAKKTTGFIIINLDSPGADISIDGVTVGKTPLIDPVFVKPGKHTVFAAFQGRSAAASVDVKVGAATAASLTLGSGGAPPPPTPPQPETPPPTPPAPPAPLPGPGVTPPPPGPGPVPLGPEVPPGPGPGPGGPVPLSFGEWYRHHPIAWVGTGLAVIGFGMGVGGGVGAMNASSASTSDVAAIQIHIPLWNMGKASGESGVPKGADVAPSNVCNPSVLAASAKLNKEFSGACGVAQSDINNYHTGVAVMATGWVFFGLGVVGTAAYALVDWYPHRANGGTSTGGTTTPHVAVLPLVTPSVHGVGVLGSF